MIMLNIWIKVQLSLATVWLKPRGQEAKSSKSYVQLSGFPLAMHVTTITVWSAVATADGFYFAKYR